MQPDTDLDAATPSNSVQPTPGQPGAVPPLPAQQIQPVPVQLDAGQPAPPVPAADQQHASLADDYTEATIAVLVFLLRVGITGMIFVLQTLLNLLNTVPNVNPPPRVEGAPVIHSQMAASFYNSATTMSNRIGPVMGSHLNQRWYAVTVGRQVGVFNHW